MATKKITPAIERAILEMAADGLSSRAIAKAIEEQHGVKLAFQNVASLLKKTKVERADIAKAVVRAKLSKTVLGDLDRIRRVQIRMGRLQTRFDRLANLGLDRVDELVARPDGIQNVGPETLDQLRVFVEFAAKIADRCARFAGQKLKLSGAEEGDEPRAPDGAVDDLLGELDRIAANASASRRAGQGDSAPDAGTGASSQV